MNNQSAETSNRDYDKAARCGEPSYVWREGQERRLQMILEATKGIKRDTILENGCGVGMYVEHLVPHFKKVIGLEYDYSRASEAHEANAQFPHAQIINAAGENLPFPPRSFDAILSHEVLEHVLDDRKAVEEMVRVLRPNGRVVLFVPNRGYPFETHGIYWKGEYHFGNKPFVNYLPMRLRNKLAPHVRIYSKGSLEKLFNGLPVRFVHRTIIFGAYDNIIRRFPAFGGSIRTLTHTMEKTPLRFLGLSHFWVVEKTGELD